MGRHRLVTAAASSRFYLRGQQPLEKFLNELRDCARTRVGQHGRPPPGSAIHPRLSISTRATYTEPFMRSLTDAVKCSL